MSEFEAFVAKVTGGTSLDDLLRSNKEKFDAIYSDRMRRLPNPEAVDGQMPEAGPTTREPAEQESGAAPTDTVPPTADVPETATGSRALTIVPEADQEAAPIAFRDGPGPAVSRLVQVALAGACTEMQTVFGRAVLADSQCKAAVADPAGQIVAASSVTVIKPIIHRFHDTIQADDMLLANDPYATEGAVGHLDHWLLAAPVFAEGRCVAWCAVRGDMGDVGAQMPGAMQGQALSLFGEGLSIPPVKLYDGGVLNTALHSLLQNNSRTPADLGNRLTALVQACRAGCARVAYLYKRFGAALFEDALAGILARCKDEVGSLLVRTLPEEPQSFADQVDDDGQGNGPFTLKVTIWREGNRAFIDWTGTAPEAVGAINAVLHPAQIKWHFLKILARGSAGRGNAGKLLINDGFLDLIDVTLPSGSLIRPNPQAPVSAGRHVFDRSLEALRGCLIKAQAIAAQAAGYGGAAVVCYFGRTDQGRVFQMTDAIGGGLPAAADRDGADGQLLSDATAEFEHLEARGLLRIEAEKSRIDSGGAGQFRGGNGIEKIYRFLVPGYVSIQDDRHLSAPWGAAGGRAGSRSERFLVDAEGAETPLPAKADGVAVVAGMRLIFRTAGGGGCGDPLLRPAEHVQRDVGDRLVSRTAAAERYGVILAPEDLRLDDRASEETRVSLKHARKGMMRFDFGDRGDLKPPQAD